LRRFYARGGRFPAKSAARVNAGGASQPELYLAQSGLQAAKLKFIEIVARVSVDRNALSAALGVPIQAIDDVAFSWPGFDSPPRQQSLSPTEIQRLALLNRIDLRRQLAQYAAADEALKLEIAKQYADMNIAGGYSWEGGENIFELGPSAVLPVFNQNQGPIAEAEARRREVAAQFRAIQAGIIEQSQTSLTRVLAALLAGGELSLGSMVGFVTLFGIESDEEERVTSAPSKISHTPGRDVVVELTRDEQARIGLETAGLTTIAQSQEAIAYGVVLGPAPLAALDAELATTRAAVAASRAEYERARLLHSEQENVSLKDFEIARAKFQADQAQFNLLNHRLADEWGTTISAMAPAERPEAISELCPQSAWSIAFARTDGSTDCSLGLPKRSLW
jgi:hypothetical protein